MTKAELRKQAMERRRSLGAANAAGLSADIAYRFPREVLDGVEYIHTYYPIVGKYEVNSLLIVDAIRKARPDIKFVLPKSDLGSCTLSHILWTDDTALAVNKWGITEPENGQPIEVSMLQIVLMPLLAFDTRGNRLGYGKGFYDRFLGENPGALRVGLSYFGPEPDDIPAETHDKTLDICITPDCLYDFRKGSKDLALR